jgi:hypothetical protein
VVVFHVPTLNDELDVEERPGQLWVAWSMESEANYPCLADPAFMAQFDLSMTYRRDAGVWSPYFGPGFLSQLRAPQAKTEAAPAVYIVSNAFDLSGRNQYVAELMQSGGRAGLRRTGTRP